MTSDTETFTEEEAAYFESGGEVAPTKAEEPKAEPEAKEPGEAKEPAEPEKAEAKEEAPAEKKPEAPKQDYVPQSALHEERERRKDIERQHRELAERNARLEERTNIILQHLNGQRQQEAPQPPNPEEDFVGYVRHLEQQVNGVNGKVQDYERQQAQQQQQHYIVANYRADADRFEKETPDFRQAYDFVRESRAKQLSALRYDPVTVMQTLEQEELNLAADALQRRQSPAEMIYGLALAMGYQQATNGAAQPNGHATPNGQAPAAETPKAPEQPKQDVAKAIETIQKGQEAAKTLSGGGGPSDGPLSPEALANMSEEEFAKLEASLSKAEKRQLFGG